MTIPFCEFYNDIFKLLSIILWGVCMKRSTLRFFTFLFILLIWVVMNDGVLGINTVVGALVVFKAVFISGKLLGFDYADVFALSPFKLVGYVLFMIREIYIAGFHATRRIITGDIDPGFVTISLDPRIKSPFLRNIVGASITLTPGTITVDQKGEELVVLCLHRIVDDPSPAAAFEPRVVEMQSDQERFAALETE